MDVDEDEEKAKPKRRKLTKAAEAKLKAKEKKKKGSDDDEDEDAYTALSKSLWSSGASKPPVGSFEDCAECQKQFTVVCYTFLSHLRHF
jgi:DNA repair protein RAD7